MRPASRLLAQAVPLRRARYPLTSSSSCCCQYGRRNCSSSSNSSSNSNGRSDHDAHGAPRRRRAPLTATAPLAPFYPPRGPLPTVVTSTPAPFLPGLAPSRPTVTPAPLRPPAPAASSFFFSTATHARRTAFPRHGKAVEPVLEKTRGASRRHRKPAAEAAATTTTAAGAAATTPTAAVPAAEEEEADTTADAEAQTGAEAEAAADKGPAAEGPAETSEMSESGGGSAPDVLPATPLPSTFSATPVNDTPAAPAPPPAPSPALDAVTGGGAAEAAAAASAASAAAAAAAAAADSSIPLPSLRPLVIELGPPTTGAGSEDGQAAGAGAADGTGTAAAAVPDAKAAAGGSRGGPKGGPKALPPYVHHFDSYSLVKQLQEAGGYSQAQAITAMKAVRALLAQHLDVAQASLVSKSDVDNETYLFQAASAELRIEVRNNRRRADEQVRQQRALLQHEVDIAAQAIGQELVSLNDVVRGLFDDRKMAVREEQRALESKIQQLSYKIATDLNSEMRSEIEGMRWVMIWRAVLGILFMALLTMVTLRYARYRNREKQKQAEAEAAAAAATAAAAAAAAAAKAAEARAADAGRPPDAGEVSAVNR